MTPQVISLSSATSSAWIPVDYKQNPFNISLAVVLSNTPSLTCKVEYTLDDVFNAAITPTVFTVPGLSAISDNSTGQITSSVKAIRLTVSTWVSGTATLTALQGTIENNHFKSDAELLAEHADAHVELGLLAPSRDPLIIFEAPFTGITVTSEVGCTINSSGLYTLNGETVWRIVASSVGTFKYFEVEIPAPASGFSCTNATFECAFDDPATLMSTIYCYLGDSTYTKYMRGPAGTITGANTTRAPCRPGMTAYQFNETTWANITGFTAPVGDQIFQRAKIRINPADGATTTVYIKRISIGGRSKSRIAITADDGYSSWVNIGQPILDEYNLVSTMSIIPISIGDTGYASWTDLTRFVSNGRNICIAHGPNHPTTKGNGNLWTAWTTDSERLADVLYARDALVSRNLTTEQGAKCYVWPQGVYTSAEGNTTFLQLLVDNGFRLGRGTTGDTFRFFRASAISETNPGRLILNIAGGHTFTSAGTEAANIAAIISYIQACATTGLDCCLVLHRVVGVDAAATSIEISSNRLRELCVAIKDLVDAGDMECVTFPELIY